MVASSRVSLNCFVNGRVNHRPCTDPTGFNPGMGASPLGNGFASQPPQPQSNTVDTSPANVFAKMKSGAFGSDSGADPQAAGMSLE